MNTVEKFFLETMDKCNFRNCIDDDFFFFFCLIDGFDIEKIRALYDAEVRAQDTVEINML